MISYYKNQIGPIIPFHFEAYNIALLERVGIFCIPICLMKMLIWQGKWVLPTLWPLSLEMLTKTLSLTCMRVSGETFLAFGTEKWLIIQKWSLISSASVLINGFLFGHGSGWSLEWFFWLVGLFFFLKTWAGPAKK